MFPLQILLIIFSALPTLIQTAEQAFSGIPGSGAAKKSLVQSGVTTALNVAATVSGKPLDPSHASAILTETGTLIDSTVAILNTAGVLKK